jgi:Tfp pilus assembly protein PilF
MRLGKEDAARSLFEQTVVADKKHPQAWQAWGVMETRAGNFKRASVIFQQGIKHNPHHADLWLGYASLEVRRGNTMNARTLFAAGLNKVQNRKFILFQGWAKLELRQGNYQSARKLISEALTMHKRNGRGWLVAAQIEEEDGNTGLVSLLLRRGIECSPGYADLYRKLGDYLVNRGKIDDAREVLEKGIALNPMYAPLYHSLAELEARICNLDALARLNKRTAELFHSNALESTPLPLLDEAFGSRIKSAQPRQVDRGNSNAATTSSYQPSSRVTALSQQIGSDSYNVDDDGVDDLDDDDEYDNDKEFGDDDNCLSLLVGDDIDPMLTLEGLGRRNIMMMDDEDSLVGDLLNVEPWEDEHLGMNSL